MARKPIPRYVYRDLYLEGIQCQDIGVLIVWTKVALVTCLATSTSSVSVRILTGQNCMLE